MRSKHRPHTSDSQNSGSHDSGSKNSVVVNLPIAEAFALVADPRTYPEWLVGAQEITEVSDAWPAVGSAFHHRIGVGPVRIPGSTSVREVDAPRRLTLGAGMGPLGEAQVEFTLDEVDHDNTSITVVETPSGGLAKLSWLASRPLITVLLWGRNAASLEMLSRLAHRA